MKIWVATNGRPSESAAQLTQLENFGRAIKGGKIKPTDTLINWGCAVPLSVLKQPSKVYNQPWAVAQASNKLKAFVKFAEAGVPTPMFTTDKTVAESWSHTVFARTKLTGHSGDGIIVIPKGEDFVDAPLYTFYIFKEREYRVHVVNGKVIDTQRKIRDMSKEVLSWKIRSHENGFMFARGGISRDKAREKVCIDAIKALGLDFGAVDVIQDKDGQYYVLEVNTAPGLEGQTINSYQEAFLELAGFKSTVEQGAVESVSGDAIPESTEDGFEFPVTDDDDNEPEEDYVP